MSHAQPIQNIGAALQERQVSQHWWTGRATVDGRTGAFFARTRGELIFKYREWMKKFKRQPDPATEQLSHTFRDLHGFGAGDQVHYEPDYKQHGYTIGSLHHPHRVYTIALTGYQGDDTPVAWLNGVPGCVPISRLSHFSRGGDVA